MNQTSCIEWMVGPPMNLRPIVEYWIWGVAWRLLARRCVCDRCIVGMLRAMR